MNAYRATGVILGHLAQGGAKRVTALDNIALMIRTDCGRQVGEMVGKGWESKDAAEAYREWLLNWAAETVETFIAEDLL